MRFQTQNSTWLDRRAMCAALVALVAACGGQDDEPDVENRSGALIRTELLDAADVGGMRYTVQRVDCADGTAMGDRITIERPLEDILIPGGIGELERSPLDAGSSHLFADMFMVLEPGCYDVLTTPLDADGHSSALCAVAWQNGIEIVAEETTEVFLINQCVGEEKGAIDVISVLNHEPELVDLWFEDSKFATCNETQIICATVRDVDRDPLEFAWWSSPENPRMTGPIVISRSDDPINGTATECISVTGEQPGRYENELVVYDLAWREGVLVRIEEWLRDAGYPNESHARLAFPFYVGDCCVPPKLDMILLQDLSGSFADDLPVVRSIIGGLYRSITDISPDALFGVASFVDKPYWPFGVATDWVYQQELALTGDVIALQTTYDGLVLGNGFDGAESQLEALLQIANNADAYAIRPGSSRYVVVVTDFSYHQAGDCYAPDVAPVPIDDVTSPFKCTERNNLDDLVQLLEDYPSAVETGRALADAGMTPMFLVTADQVLVYEALVAMLGIPAAEVVVLEPDSANLVDAVLEGFGCP